MLSIRRIVPVLVLGTIGATACSVADPPRPSLGAVVTTTPTTAITPTTPTTPPGGTGADTAETIPTHPSGDPWFYAIDVPPDADPCGVLHDSLLAAALGPGDHEPPARAGATCRVRHDGRELRLTIVDHGDHDRDTVRDDYYERHEDDMLEPVTAAAPILSSLTNAETVVFLVSSTLIFEYDELVDRPAFDAALAEAMRRADEP